MTVLRKSFIGLAVALATLVIAGHASAVTLIPPVLEYGVKPGETLTSKVKLFNEGTTDIVLYPTTDNFVAGDESGTAKFTNTPTEDLASWIVIAKDPIALHAGERTEVSFSVQVPTNADPGGHYGVLFFGTQPNQTNGTGVAVASKIGALLILRVEGVTLESGRLTDFSTTTGTTMFRRPPVDFLIRMENVGNVHIRPTGTITIRNVLGGTTAILQVNESQGAVLPKTFRKFTSTWQKSMSEGSSAGFFGEVARERKNFALGPYTAETSLTYGLANDKIATATLHFWVFPWHLLLVVLIVILAVIFLLVFGIKRYNRWIVTKARR